MAACGCVRGALLVAVVLGLGVELVVLVELLVGPVVPVAPGAGAPVLLGVPGAGAEVAAGAEAEVVEVAP
jgi:hypothetical protein